MEEHIYAKIFQDAYMYKFAKNNINVLAGVNLDLLEETLKQFIVEVIGYRFNYNLGEVRVYFENICNNISLYRGTDLIGSINRYKEAYLNLLETHPYVNNLIEVLKRVYDADYDGKLGYTADMSYSANHNKDGATINHFDNSFIIAKAFRTGEIPLPSVRINEIDNLEIILSEFINAIKNSDTAYNIFNNENFENFTEKSKIQMLFEGIILNANSYELYNIEIFFKKYRDMLLDKTLEQFKSLNFLGNAFDDEIYFKIKDSDIEYETPYYFSFMLRDYRVELPNVRLGIVDDVENGKIAHIITTQTSQFIRPTPELSEDIKKNIPNTPMYNFFNPEHFISILITMGILNGMGIQKIKVQNFVPLRYHKTILDKRMSDNEAENYIRRVVDKNIYTYLKLSYLCEGITITDYPDSGVDMTLCLSDVVKCKNDFLDNLYSIGYEFGKRYHINDNTKKKTL